MENHKLPQNIVWRPQIYTTYFIPQILKLYICYTGTSMISLSNCGCRRTPLHPPHSLEAMGSCASLASGGFCEPRRDLARRPFINYYFCKIGASLALLLKALICHFHFFPHENESNLGFLFVFLPKKPF